MVYGTNINENILHTIPTGTLRIISELVLLVCNVMFAFLIVLNPFSQNLEDFFHVPHREYK